MKPGEVVNLVTLAAIGIGGYWLYKKFADAGNKASETLADAYVRATAGPVIKVLASAVLPNGQKIPMSAVKITDTKNFLFSYGGKSYKLLKRRPDNDYDAALAGLRGRR